MNRRGNIFAIFLCSFLVFSASTNPRSKLEELQIPVRNLAGYHFNPQTPLSDRIGEVPGFVLDYVKEYDHRTDYAPYPVTSAERKTIISAIDQLPPLHKKVLQERLIGIYIVDNLLGNGFTDWVQDKDGNLYCFILFNPRSLKMTISQILTSRELTVFKNNDPEAEISIECGTDQSAFLYILLHETSHVIDFVKHITPLVEPGMEKFDKHLPKTTPFVEGRWIAYSQPVKSNDFLLRKDITVYGFGNGPKINLSDAKELYTELEQTGFASLYGSKTWAEDFAEYLAFYHLTQKMKLSYQITVSKNHEPILVYKPMTNPKVASRFSQMQQFYK